MDRASCVAILTLLVVAGACAQGARESETTAAALPSLAALDPGWTMLRPGGDTICSLGTEFSFFAHPGDSERLLIFLQGGGACWNGRTCDPEGEPSYSQDVDESDNPGNRAAGVFDLDEPRNPFADHSIVMIPYCTGDVHLGDRVARYTAEREDGTTAEVTIHHRGYTNVSAALDWVYDNFEAPGEIFVTGSSAGSIPSPFYADIVADHYPDARVTALGDGSGSYNNSAAPDADNASVWGMLPVVQRQAGYEDFTTDTLSFEDLYIVAGQQHPEMRLYQFDTAGDAVQGFFLRLAGNEDADLHALIKQNRTAIRAAIGNFEAFTAGGHEHTILGQSRLYYYEAGDGELLSEWLAAVAHGASPPSVSCTDCSRPGLHYSDRDLQIVQRADELLADVTAWNRADRGRCDSTDGLSLRCALVRAAQEIGGSRAVTAVMTDARATAAARLPDANPRSPLATYNNRPETAFEDIKSVLAEIRERAGSHEHD